MEASTVAANKKSFAIKKNAYQTREQAQDQNKMRVENKIKLTVTQIREAKKLVIKKKKLENKKQIIEEETKKTGHNKKSQEQELKLLNIDLQEVTQLNTMTEQSLSRLQVNYETLTNKIAQLNNLSEELTRKTQEEREVQSRSNIDVISEQARARYTNLRNNIVNGHRQLQNAVPLLMFLSNARGEDGEPIMQPLLEMTMHTLSRFSNAANGLGVGAVARSEGLSADDIKKVKEVQWSRNTTKKNETFESCPICYSDYTSGEKIKELPCCHAFHGPCIEEWLKKKAKCPMCNKEVKPSDL